MVTDATRFGTGVQRALVVVVARNRVSNARALVAPVPCGARKTVAAGSIRRLVDGVAGEIGDVAPYILTGASGDHATIGVVGADKRAPVPHQAVTVGVRWRDATSLVGRLDVAHTGDDRRWPGAAAGVVSVLTRAYIRCAALPISADSRNVGTGAQAVVAGVCRARVAVVTVGRCPWDNKTARGVASFHTITELTVVVIDRRASDARSKVVAGVTEAIV